MYDNGDGVPKNKAEAVKLYTKAADQGLPQAQFDLGVAYYNGDGVPKNIAEAKKWIKKAADQGFEKAKEALKTIQ
jgi:hypothetical protein